MFNDHPVGKGVLVLPRDVVHLIPVPQLRLVALARDHGLELVPREILRHPLATLRAAVEGQQAMPQQIAADLGFASPASLFPNAKRALGRPLSESQAQNSEKKFNRSSSRSFWSVPLL